MTEAEWLECSDPGAMLKYLRGKVSDRKLRVFAAASFRRLVYLLPDCRQHRGIELMEQMAAGTVTVDKREVIRQVRHALPTHDSSVGAPPTDDPYFVALMLYRELVSS